jgi:hypothetical protein
LVEALAELIDRLEASGLDYALGGAIAYGAWAEPRATIDVDLNVWAAKSEIHRVFDTLESAGVAITRGAAERDAEDRGMFVGYRGAYRVDVFVPSVPFYEIARQRRVRVGLMGRATWVLSPEVLAVFKMLFFRPKDLADVGRLLEIAGARFEQAFVRNALVEMLGVDDVRIAEWDRLVRDVRS